MQREEIRDYVSKYKNQYSRESIINQLVSHGVKRKEVELVFKKLETRPSQSEYKSPSVFLILFIVIIFFTFVGVLIFSIFNYVDFDKIEVSSGLLSNKLDLTNNLIGDSSSMIYDINKNEFTILVTFVGTRSSNLILEGSQVLIENKICPLKIAQNLATQTESPSDISFINGQNGLLTFDCTSLENIESGDILEGNINIILQNPKTGINIPSTGTFRTTVQ
ncbi:MAG: hypothetical protein PF569_06790 [Candidatus Woesearchaeota archaeon]|jgi:archaellum component FlaG (FlaF/FlaG flagellin family)|nr:hypothetical protein [Candidatus Woesearchaeota archaeon]